MSHVLPDITGIFYDGKSSAAQACRLVVLPDGVVSLLRADSNSRAGEVMRCGFEQLNIDSRLGGLPRHIRFPEGGMLETDDHDAVDHWQREFNPSPMGSLVFRLESRIRYVLAAVLAVVLTVWLLLQFGVPRASEWVADSLPESAVSRLGEQSLRLLDEHIFFQSQLEPSRIEELQHLFARHFEQQIQNDHLRLIFRSSERVGANAFALPSGDVLLTDDLVKLAADDRELIAILAHEVGHVRYRHVLRRIVQDSFFVAVIALVTGDVSGSSSMLALAPIALLELGYSRDYEREADDYALNFMHQQAIGTHHFANIMLRLQWQEACRSQQQATSPDDSWGRLARKLEYYLSTHPLVAERLQDFGEPTLSEDDRPVCDPVQEGSATQGSVEG